MSPPRDTAKEPDYTKPPRFHPEIDFQEWRKRVAAWVATIKKAHEKGNDRSLQTKYTLLARIFYSEALPEAQKSLVDDEISKGEIDLYNDSDPVEMVLKIVNAVAVDAPISQVTRLISSYQTVISCTRKKEERLSAFAMRFRGLAGKHLRYCGASSSSQTGQVLAITLLNHAKLDDILLTNAKMQLISLAEARSKHDESVESAKIPLSTIKPVIDAAENLKDHCADTTTDANGNVAIRSGYIQRAMDGAEELHTMLLGISTENSEKNTENDSFEEMFKEKGSMIKINLDDAVTVLRSIAEGSQTKQLFTKAEVTAMVDEKFKTFLANHGNPLSLAPPLGSSSSPSGGISKKRKGKGGKSGAKRDKKDGGNGAGGSGDRRKRRLNELVPEADDHCLDCGSKDHRRGSEDCKKPSWGTKKVREAKERETGSDSKEFQGFREGSSR